MSLPSLQWRKLPTRKSPMNVYTFTSSLVLDTIYDMLTGSFYFDGSTRIAGSGSAWSASLKFTTGSNTEAIICRPPLYTAQISQSVIFAGINNFGPSSSAAPPTVSLDLYSASYIYMAHVKNASASFTEWTSRFPFGSGSFSTGYARVACTGQMHLGQGLTIYESKEAIAVVFYNPQIEKAHVGIAGAIIDPEINSAAINAEADGRLYALATSGVAQVVGEGLSQDLATLNGAEYSPEAATGSLFNHSNGVTTDALNLTKCYPRFVGYVPQLQSVININAIKYAPVTALAGSGFIPTLGDGSQLNYGFTKLDGSGVQIPMICVVSASATSTGQNTGYANFGGNYLGRLRDINIFRAYPLNLVIKNSVDNSVLGFTLSHSENALSVGGYYTAVKMCGGASGFLLPYN